MYGVHFPHNYTKITDIGRAATEKSPHGLSREKPYGDFVILII